MRLAAAGAAVLAVLPVVASAQVPAPAGGAPAAVRQLVYRFTFGTTTDLERNTSGIAQSAGSGPNDPGAASGMADSTASLQDQGTITVDVVRLEPDRGLVVRVSEQARGRRSAAPATCVVYANTSTICDASKRINDEELTLIRLLNPAFVDPTRLDAKRHWSVHPNTAVAKVAADYTIDADASGVMRIGETRTTQTQSGRTYATYGTIAYDFNRLLPTRVHSNTIERQATTSSYTTNTEETTLALQSDATVAASPTP